MNYGQANHIQQQMKQRQVIEAPAASIAQPTTNRPAQMQRNNIQSMATAANAIEFWNEHFDYINSEPIVHSDMLQIARILRNSSEEIARLRGEIGVMCKLMDQALDVMTTVNGDDENEDRKILKLRAKIASAIDHFMRAMQPGITSAGGVE